MAQENITDAPLPEGSELVKLQEPVTVYATGKLSATHAVGEEMNVHRALAEKLIASGKATKDDPNADKKAKPAK